MTCFCHVAISTECAEYSYFYLIWHHVAACGVRKFAISIRTPHHNIHKCAQKQMAAFVLWLGSWLTHILHSLPLLGIRLRYQFSNMHLSPLFELHWLRGGGGVTYHLFLLPPASDDLMIFSSGSTILSGQKVRRIIKMPHAGDILLLYGNKFGAHANFILKWMKYHLGVASAGREAKVSRPRQFFTSSLPVHATACSVGFWGR